MNTFRAYFKTTNKILFSLIFIISLFACNNVSNNENILVTNEQELQKAIENAQAGDEIVMANGIWKDVRIQFTAQGTESKPIILRAEKEGEVFIEGKSDLKFGGEYLVVSGLYFRNGYTPSRTAIDFRINEDQVANHCRVTNCVIENYNQPNRDRADHWVEFWGRHNQLDHCYIAGKSNQNPTIRVYLLGNESIKNFHQITNNHFGPRPRVGGPHGETIQIGSSNTSMSPSNMIVANNLFEECNGEVEIISNKSNFNEFRNNVFYKSEGSLVMRHGNYCIIDANYFIGDGISENFGGIRIVNTGHWITNNYFFKIIGENFRSPLAVMNGIPKSPLNRYNQVTDVVVAYNTWIDCKSPWQFSVGTNVSQKDVLPLSEIRSARPERMIVANNIIYNEVGDPKPIVAYDVIDGVSFKNNIINNKDVAFEQYDGLQASEIEMSKLSEFIYVPVNNQADTELYKGFDFESITKDLFGNSRSEKNSVGAICQSISVDPMILDKKKYGASWYSNEKAEVKGQILTASSEAGDLASKIAEANNGDVIELLSGTYEISSSLVINKEITLQSKDENNKAQINYTGASKTPAFELNPEGNLLLKNVVLNGNKEQYAFASLRKNMSSHYNLRVEGSEISNFDYVLKAYKESFADEILFSNVVIKDCQNGFELSEQTENKGFYNAEFLTIENCQFNNVKSNVIDYYRGGYDESTIGGNLLVTNSTFTNCGGGEKNGILLNTRGIVNVYITKNSFKNNSVKLVALLWGAKNNNYSDNEILNSGKILVEENLKLDLVY
jgi:poly(beta-D-mannuronate) lyase